MTRRFCVPLVLLTIPLTTACLVKTTTHRLYLSPQGALTWSVLEQDVRSSESNLANRAAEEHAFLDGVASGTHPALEAFTRLAPSRTSVRLLRAERPYTVQTDAHFERVDAVVEALLSELHVPGKATLQREGDEWTLTIAIDLSAVGDEDVDTPVATLLAELEELEAYRVILTDGRFIAAAGFEVLDEGAAARLAPARIATDRPVELRLTWR
jgi:hypothetical protein